MRPLDQLPSRNGWRVLDPHRDILMDLGNGRDIQVRVDGKSVPVLLAATEHDVTQPGWCTAISSEATMKSVIQARQTSGLPVIMTAEGRVVGLCGEDEILHALASEGWQTVQAAN